MITLLKGDLLTSKVEAIVNPVNTVGIMGKGLALDFSIKFQENFLLYKKACKRGEVQIGKMFVTELGNSNSFIKYIINFPTKLHFSQNSQLEYIEKGLIDLIRVVNDLQIKSLGIPALGCGLGGLSWQVVKPLLTAELDNNLPEVNILLFEPIK